MERQRPSAERARRNRATATRLMQRKHSPQYRLRLIQERHQSINFENPSSDQITIWNEKELTQDK